jgi:hypothetical protein
VEALACLDAGLLVCADDMSTFSVDRFRLGVGLEDLSDFSVVSFGILQFVL